MAAFTSSGHCKSGGAYLIGFRNWDISSVFMRVMASRVTRLNTAQSHFLIDRKSLKDARFHASRSDHQSCSWWLCHFSMHGTVLEAPSA
jgi:hypothetical protein